MDKNDIHTTLRHYDHDTTIESLPTKEPRQYHIFNTTIIQSLLHSLLRYPLPRPLPVDSLPSVSPILSNILHLSINQSINQSIYQPLTYQLLNLSLFILYSLSLLVISFLLRPSSHSVSPLANETALSTKLPLCMSCCFFSLSNSRGEKVSQIEITNPPFNPSHRIKGYICQLSPEPGM